MALGRLYIVSTPIGNLEDITLRALRVLKEADVVAAEDTRKTGRLLDHFNIRTRLLSYHSYNEQRRIPQLIERLKNGETVALVSDAGTPGISDPAYQIVCEAIREGLPVVPVPGATAFLPALVSSALPTESFVFAGFLPTKKGRKTKLEQLRLEKRTVVLYEAPHRILRTLRDLREMFGDRDAAVGRELTKKFEEIVRGKLSDLIAKFESQKILGEFVVVVEGCK